MNTPNDMAQNMGVQKTAPSNEMATAAMAAKAKAGIESRYIIAYNRPRNIDQARIDILAACRRPGFAEAARYKKPVGGQQTVDGFSIRFAEEAIKAMRNIAVDSTTVYEDESKRTVQISVTDLENNITYGKEVTISKTVERKSLRQGQTPISQRTNSTGQITYLVEASEDEIANKIASAESKVIRNCGLRLVPSDILEESEAVVEETLLKGGGDVRAGAKKITDAFAAISINPVEIEKYLGHSLATVSPKELADLRAIYATIKDGQASWGDYVGVEKEPQKKPDLGAKKKPADTAPPPALPGNTEEPKTPQESMEAYLDSAGVSWEDFRGFLISDGHYLQADSVATIHELPGDVCLKLSKDAKAMSKLVKTFGKVAAK